MDRMRYTTWASSPERTRAIAEDGKAMHISVLGVPMDLGADRRGVDMGPSAIRYAGLTGKLRELGNSVSVFDSISVPDAETLDHGDPKLKFLDPIVEVSSQLATRVQRILGEGSLPVV